MVVSFPRAQYSVRERDQNLSFCVQIMVGPHTKQRNVSLHLFTTNISANGDYRLPNCRIVVFFEGKSVLYSLLSLNSNTSFPVLIIMLRMNAPLCVYTHNVLAVS